MISGNLEDLASLIMKRLCVYQHLLVYISKDFSSSLAIEIYGWPFLWRHSYIESTTILSDYGTSILITIKLINYYDIYVV